MVMDAKDLRTESTLVDRSNDGTNKYTQIGTALPCASSKSYQNLSPNSMAKSETPTSRPCAVIGPDRVLPPMTNTDSFLKKGPYEPWPPLDSTYRHPPEYPHKVASLQSPLRNISPRQTFQENMQRIMVPATCHSKINDETSFLLDRSSSTNKTNKLNMSTEPKYCDVPYSINPLSDNQKINEMCVPNVNNTRSFPPMWHPGSVNIRPPRPYGGPELYQYPDYANYVGPRSVAMSRPQRSEETSQMYPDAFYHHGNVRYKPYPNVKERYPPTRYEFLNNYVNPCQQPPPFPSHKYDLQKSLPPHPSYPQVPIKYLDSRMNDSVMDGYQRPTHVNCNVYQNQMIHPAYSSLLPNGVHNKLYPHQPDNSLKAPPSNKIYLEYEAARNKTYPASENYNINDIGRPALKSQVMASNYSSMNMQPIPPHPYYRKDAYPFKSHEFLPQYRHFDPTLHLHNHLGKYTSEFPPNGNAISPSDSSSSIDTMLTQGNNSLEDCGYVSQSSATSARSLDFGVNRIYPNDYQRRYNYPYHTMVRSSPITSKTLANHSHSKDKKGIDVRQFLQMWNEGDDESASTVKENSHIDHKNEMTKVSSQHEAKSQEQLYVLGLVNVPSEELGKYEHIQKVSKLPDNIKGYNNIELLKHFEEAIESSNLNNFNHQRIPTPRHTQLSKNVGANIGIPVRPLSPLDVEAKISQSVIHKDVGCNFEIKPCSPEMLNVEVATPVQNIINERVIEKVTNPYQATVGSTVQKSKLMNCNMIKPDHTVLLEDNSKIPSCKLINNPCPNNEIINDLKSNYTFQDLESNSGVCLASLPRLDNDIELNFPEVNQQFINANKDSVIIPNDTESEFTYNTKDNQNSNEQIITFQENEKEFAKLSKYRKVKKCDSESKDLSFINNSQSMRTDSVIIKNPENNKFCEESSNNLLNKTINDKSDDEASVKCNNITNEIPNDCNENDKSHANSEKAIDFSFNKTKSMPDLLSTDKNVVSSYEENEIENIHTANDTKYLLEDSDMTKDSFSDILCDNIIMRDDTQILEKHKNNDNKNNINSEMNVINDLSKTVNNDTLTPLGLTPHMFQNNKTNENQSVSPGFMQEHSFNLEFHKNIDNPEISLELLSPKVQQNIVPIVFSNDNNLGLNDKGADNSDITLECVTPKLQQNILSTELSNKNNENLCHNESDEVANSIKLSSCLQSENNACSENALKDSSQKEIQLDLLDIANKISIPDEECVPLSSPKNVSAELYGSDHDKCDTLITKPQNSLDKPDELNKCQDNIKIDIKDCDTLQIISKVENLKNNNNQFKFISESVNVRKEYNNMQTNNNNKSKFCNLKKKLFSPWIQNLILFSNCSDSSKAERKKMDCADTAEINTCLAKSQKDVNEPIYKLPVCEDWILESRCSSSSSENLSRIENENNTEDVVNTILISNDCDHSQNLLTELHENENQNQNISCNINNNDINEKETFEDEKIYVSSQNICDQNLLLTGGCLKEGRVGIKRSISDSALNYLEGDNCMVEKYSRWIKRPKKGNECANKYDTNILSESVCDNINNRRNSISSLGNSEDLSFCIVIDNDCILTPDSECQNICFAETSDSCMTSINCNEENLKSNSEYLVHSEEKSGCSEPFVLELPDHNTFENSWVDDIACVETVVSDELTEENAMSAQSSPNICDFSGNNESDLLDSNTEHTDKVRFIYGDKMCNDDAEFVETLYRTPQMNVNKTLTYRESHFSEDHYNINSNNNVVCEDLCCIETRLENITNDNGNVISKDTEPLNSFLKYTGSPSSPDFHNNNDTNNSLINTKKTQDDTVHSCESSLDDVFSCNNKPRSGNASSSPEVSSTTSEDKSSGILLKITNYKGMRMSRLKNVTEENKSHISKNSCKFTENVSYTNSNNPANPRPLITKAAQKYIPPIKEVISDLKVKLTLPPQSLIRLKQLKISKTQSRSLNNRRHDVTIKPKPKFEDVLKSIDEIHIKMHKEKSKRPKNSVPKVFIKKNENGSHYTSSSSKDNPDLTGRKWQPWVFIEKDMFIDKMAIKNKTKAIFNHRKNCYMLKEKFKKYKSIPSAKFFISKPMLDDSSSSKLKYTIRLKHNY